MYVCRYVNGSKVGGVLLILFFFFFLKRVSCLQLVEWFSLYGSGQNDCNSSFQVRPGTNNAQQKKKKTGCRFTNINFIYVLLGPLF